MYIINTGLKFVVFNEHPTKRGEEKPSDYDLAIPKNRESFSGYQLNDEFCLVLLRKLLLIRKPCQEEFLLYQINLLKDPLIWLTQLEELLSQNVDFFYCNRASHLLPTMQQQITKLISKLQLVATKGKKGKLNNNKITNSKQKHDSPYLIEKFKKHLPHLESFIEKLMYLRRMKADYMQLQYKYKKQIPVDFVKQVDLELKFLFDREEILQALQKNIPKQKDKLIINGPISIMAYAFLDLMKYPADNAKTYLSISPKEAIDFILTTMGNCDGTALDKQAIVKILLPEKQRNSYSKNSLNNVLTRNALVPNIEATNIDLYDYNLEKIKNHLMCIDSIEQRQIILKRIKTNYLQHHVYKQGNLFLKQLKIELSYQSEIGKLQKVKAKDVDLRLRINGHVNVLVDIFFKLYYETASSNDKNYLLTNPTNITRWLIAQFKRANGSPLKFNSIRTQLNPSKVGKRPPIHKQIRIRKSLIEK